MALSLWSVLDSPVSSCATATTTSIMSSPTVSDSDSVSNPQYHPNYYIEEDMATVVVSMSAVLISNRCSQSSYKVENTYFRVPQNLLTQESERFRQIFMKASSEAATWGISQVFS